MTTDKLAADAVIDHLEAEARRLRALLAEGCGHHGAGGQFCVRGTLEDGTPCPTCGWARRVRAILGETVAGISPPGGYSGVPAELVPALEAVPAEQGLVRGRDDSINDEDVTAVGVPEKRA